MSHIANGATRLQPIVMQIGQAAGMAAALCTQRGCQPRELPVRVLQEALLQDPVAPAAVIPLLNLTCDRPDWLYWQRYYLDRPEEYPISGDRPVLIPPTILPVVGKRQRTPDNNLEVFSGIFYRRSEQDYSLKLTDPDEIAGHSWKLVTLRPEVDRFLQSCLAEKFITVWGRRNFAGNWLLVEIAKDEFSN